MIFTLNIENILDPTLSAQSFVLLENCESRIGEPHRKSESVPFPFSNSSIVIFIGLKV